MPEGRLKLPRISIQTLDIGITWFLKAQLELSLGITLNGWVATLLTKREKPQ